MGVCVSDWKLARSVSQLGQLGVVSGTALDVVLARRLQMGDPGGHLTRAAEHFPFPEMVREVWRRYFIQGGKKREARFTPVPLHSIRLSRDLNVLTVLANFIEVFLAKEGHSGTVGINFLEKIQLPTLPSIFGAMLAGVDYVLMGAGIPRSIPHVLDQFAKGQPAELKIDVKGAGGDEEHSSAFDPAAFCGGNAPSLARPRFLGIVSSATLAITLAKKSSGKVDGFIVEGATAGGHNAPPRGPLQLTPEGEPQYGARDVPELGKIRDLGLPFWMAGSYGRPGKLAEARSLGAAGIQVGTAFAFCSESGIAPELKQKVIEESRAGKAHVFTDPSASPTGFPLKVIQLDGTLSEPGLYEKRRRVCDLGYLRHAYRKADGSAGYRCPGEPIDDYVRKGGTPEETAGRKCVCNGLLATAGLAQWHPEHGMEQPLLTAGNDVSDIAQFLKPGSDSYSAADVIDSLLH